MSCQFGIVDLSEPRCDYRNLLDQAGSIVPGSEFDEERVFVENNFGVFYRRPRATDDVMEVQPYLSGSGAVTIWDGRLDNRKELVEELGLQAVPNLWDAGIVAAAYQRWSLDCFRRILGDWAISIWDPVVRTLILARDFVGTKSLFYFAQGDRILWSSALDPLVLLSKRSFHLEREYVAGWLSFFPAAHLTPYVGIQAVPPCCTVSFRREEQKVRQYWDFEPKYSIHYKSDREYEQHFLFLFRQSVERRLHSPFPVLSELSGGMDSSAIVCVADRLIDEGRGRTPRLDTVSYFDSSEPNWNEEPYFTQVEQQRGRAGCHISVAAKESHEIDTKKFEASPAARGCLTRPHTELLHCIAKNGNRVLLSGLGGDEVLGGRPSALPALADLLAAGSLITYLQEVKRWALHNGLPFFHLFRDSVAQVVLPGHNLQTGRWHSWLRKEFVQSYGTVLAGYPIKSGIFQARPSFRERRAGLEFLRRQLTCISPFPSECERRYPYLDRDLLEYLFAIPYEQLVRPGERRSLMRRSLVGIVPESILKRRRKAFVARASHLSVANRWKEVFGDAERSYSARMGIVDPGKLEPLVLHLSTSDSPPVVGILRTIRLESWLKNVIENGVLDPELASGAKHPRLQKVQLAS